MGEYVSLSIDNLDVLTYKNRIGDLLLVFNESDLHTELYKMNGEENVRRYYSAKPNNTYINYINYINPILSVYTEDEIDGIDEYQAYSEIIRENIDMESLVKRYPYEQKDVQEIYELIVETVVGKGGV